VNSKSKSWLAVALLQIGMAGNALAVSIYNERAAFEATLDPGTLTVEDFESEYAFGLGDIPNGKDSLDLNYFSVSSAEPVIKIMGYAHSGSHNTTSSNTTIDGTNYLYLDTDTGLQGSTTTISLKNPADAFGFNYTGVYEPGTAFTVSIGSSTFTVTPNNPEGDPLFWGILGLGIITDITITTSLDSGFGVDDVTFGMAVPLPPALWLFGSGLLALAGGSAKRKSHS